MAHSVHVHSHWLGFLLFAGALLLSAGVAGIRSVRVKRLRQAKRIAALLVSLAAAAVVFTGAGPLAAVAVLVICWVPAYGLVWLAVTTAMALFESVTAKPPVIARQNEYRRKVRGTIGYSDPVSRRDARTAAGAD